MDDAASSLPQVAGLSPSAALAAQKTFLLRVGCRKGGRTWLHDYLSCNPNADMGFRKEYHLANRRFDPENDNYLTTSQVRSMYWRAILQGAWIRNQNHLAWLSFLQRPERYFAYFSQLVSRSEAIRVTGDITPSYAGLPVSALEQIRDGITAQGLRIKVLFLMRDPAERVVS